MSPRKSAPQPSAAEPSPEPAAEGQAKPAESAPEAKPEQAPAPRRAGGHIDRGDGRGWELEE